MSDSDLLFYQSPLTTGDLVFNDTSGGVLPSVTADFAATLPSLTVAVNVAEVVRANFAATLPGLTMAATGAYDNRLTRYMQGIKTAAHSTAIETRPTLDGSWDTAVVRKTPHASPWQRAVRSGKEHAVGYTPAQPTRAQRVASHQVAGRVNTDRVSSSQIGIIVRNARSASHSTAARLAKLGLTDRMQVANLLRRYVGGQWQTAIPFFRPTVGAMGASLFAIGPQATVGEWQVALQLQAGSHPPIIVPPVGHVCYTPSGDLVFYAAQSSSTDLLFICDDETISPPAGQIIVPVRKVYQVANNIQLRRVSDNALIPCESASLALDVDSWTWSFSGTIPGEALSMVSPGSGPVEVNLSVNGTSVRLMIENVGRDRTFGQSKVKIAGRGINAELDAPYAATQTFGGYGTLTAQQVMAQVLTLNGIPLDWDITWQIEDWSVPAGVFNHQGTYISALNAISAAAGAYLQPGLSTRDMIVKHRYPTAPWEWDDVDADIVLPSDVVVQEGLQWHEKPAYNRVYVSGQGQGVLGRVTRAGTAGDLLAPMVTDQLIVSTEVARQNGRAVLSDTGKQVRASLGLPVLAETGMILPGTFVQYEDGPTTRRGIVRSLNVSMGFPNVWQTIEVETHL